MRPVGFPVCGDFLATPMAPGAGDAAYGSCAFIEAGITCPNRGAPCVTGVHVPVIPRPAAAWLLPGGVGARGGGALRRGATPVMRR
jgi:hypothetical protein